jgi:uncharacterized phage protein (TIGR01671 family)
MREILFRGKRLDNGEWIEGSLLKVTLNGKTAYLIYGDNFSFVGNDVKSLSHAVIDPATICQYTGMDDIFCKQIFEGDLCLCDRNINDTFDKKVFEIKYDQCRGFYGENFNEIDAWEFCMCEIVGNIHDNPELLGGGEDG